MKRKNYLIDKEFQIKFVLRFIAVLLGTIIIAGFITFLIYSNVEKTNLTELYSAQLVEMDGSAGYDFYIESWLELTKPLIIKYLSIVLILATLLGALATFFYSHRLAGPVYRFQKQIDLIMKEEYDNKLFLRKNDEFKSLADKFNSLQEFIKDYSSN